MGNVDTYGDIGFKRDCFAKDVVVQTKVCFVSCPDEADGTQAKVGCYCRP